MDGHLNAFLPNIKKQLNASVVKNISKIQTLWSGYGGIYRLALEGGKYSSVVVKCINGQEQKKHPRGWATDLSHQRKLKSYEVESCWYKNYAQLLTSGAKVPELLYSELKGDMQVLVLEDLTINYPELKQYCTFLEAKAVVKWLAHFHAKFLNSTTIGLWKTGTYWHLETRPDEWKAMSNSLLKANAKKLDAALESAHFKTIVHGDAKVANFCFDEAKEVAAVDFQYVGGGVGVKDLAYFLGSCFSEEDCELYEDALLDFYFKTLRATLSSWNVGDLNNLEKEWRNLYPVAWADFNRFLLGWLPTYQKLHRFALKKNEEALGFI